MSRNIALLVLGIHIDVAQPPPGTLLTTMFHMFSTKSICFTMILKHGFCSDDVIHYARLDATKFRGASDVNILICLMSYTSFVAPTGIILCMGLANERRRYSQWPSPDP